MWSSFSLGVGELFSFRSTVYQQGRQNRSTGERGGDCCGVENSSGWGVFPRWWKSIVVAEFARYSWLNLKEILWNDRHVSPYFPLLVQATRKINQKTCLVHIKLPHKQLSNSFLHLRNRKLSFSTKFATRSLPWPATWEATSIEDTCHQHGGQSQI